MELVVSVLMVQLITKTNKFVIICVPRLMKSGMEKLVYAPKVLIESMDFVENANKELSTTLPLYYVNQFVKLIKFLAQEFVFVH